MPTATAAQTTNLSTHRSLLSTTHQASCFFLHVLVGAFLLYAITEVGTAWGALPEASFPRLSSTTICCMEQISESVDTASEAQKNTAPLTLDQLVELAINRHPSVSARRADLEAARADMEVARQAFYPTPAVLLQQGRSGNGTLVSLQQPLWAAGRLSAGVNAAGAHTMAADVAINETQFALALRVANAYQAWLQAHRRIAALSASIDQLASYGGRIDRRIEGGASAEVDRALVRARLFQADSDLSSAQAAEQAAIVQLSQACGYDLSGQQLDARPAELVEQAPLNLAKLIAGAVERNPGLRRVDFDITTAHYEAEQKRATLWPTISLRAEHQHSSTLGAGSNDNRLFVVLEYTPGAGLSATKQIDAQLARIQSLRDNAEATKRDLVERIAIEYQDYLAGQSRQQSMQRLQAESRNVLASYDRLFLAGKRGWLDVVNAARELTQVELTIADLSAQQVGARYRLRLLASEPLWLSRTPSPVLVDTPFQRLLDTTIQRTSQ
jgi:adhesin transport system outer membrane protein